MKGIYKGYDPKLTEEYSGRSTGVIIGLGTTSEPDFEELFIDEYGRAGDPQEVHDFQMEWRRQQKEIDEEYMAGKLMALGRVVQNVQFAARKKGIELGAVSAMQILEKADRGELDAIKPAVEALRRYVEATKGS